MQMLLKSMITLSLALVPIFAEANQSSVDVLSPSILKQLDQPGKFSFATAIGAEALEQEILRRELGNIQYNRLNSIRLKDLTKSDKFSAIASQIVRDVFEVKEKSGEKMAYSSEQAEALAPSGNVARHFDTLWLKSERAALPLIAVVNRTDKADVYNGTCGEVRFIYRLSYYLADAANGDLRESYSTLPFFLNVVYDYLPDASGSCSAIHRSWLNTSSEAELSQGALNKSNLVFKQIELNMQIVRFPSGQKTDFGGQAVYLFRIFQLSGPSFTNSNFVSVALENTPDVGAVQNSPSLKNALIQQLTDPNNLAAIDNGTFVLENSEGRLLATRALSFSTSGRGRLGNKPYTAIFGASGEELSGVNLSVTSFIKSRAGLIERMNNSTCMGCHQSGGTAGFHMLGHTDSFNSPFNQVAIPFSPHYGAERVRRAQNLAKLNTGQKPSIFRPPSFYPSANWTSTSEIPKFKTSKSRDLCTLGANDFSVGAQCASGTACVATVVNAKSGVTVGECVPTQNRIAGHVCRTGTISNSKSSTNLGDLYNLFSFRDTIDISHVISTSSSACGNPSGGVPLGRISKVCDANSTEGVLKFVEDISANTMAIPEEMCAMRGGPQFDECAKSKNPPNCLAKAKIVRAFLDTCYEGHYCREDYICQRLPKDISRVYSGGQKELVEARLDKLTKLGVGFCVPNYFVFNMRTDGHIIPEGH